MLTALRPILMDCRLSEMIQKQSERFRTSSPKLIRTHLLLLVEAKLETCHQTCSKQPRA
uniref:Uncharacterized protein n=1 Tax=Brassica oleracea TaxID=3712 RepID=A0A3P6D6G4_BRAOL|nr:unnamed protein product [Brassica oleracea]